MAQAQAQFHGPVVSDYFSVTSLLCVFALIVAIWKVVIRSQEAHHDGLTSVHLGLVSLGYFANRNINV